MGLPMSTGKSLSEALILASINPKYDDRLFIELRVQYMKTTSSEHSELVVFKYWTRNSMNNLLSYCWLVDVRISASEKDLPVQNRFQSMSNEFLQTPRNENPRNIPSPPPTDDATDVIS